MATLGYYEMKERLEYLFLRYLKSTSTEKELEEFLFHVKLAKYEQSLRDLIRQVYQSIQESDPSLASYIDREGSLVLNIEPAAAAPPEEPYQPKSTKNWKRPVLALMISLLVIGTAIAIFWSASMPRPSAKAQPLASAQSQTKKFTQVSENRFLVLSDSTQVWLNGNSYLQFPDEFTGKKREVYLSGEAWFDVKNAEEIPFIIHTGKITTTVLGTSFNIKAYPYMNSVSVSVSRGKVRVSRDDDIVAVLLRGQQVKVSSVDSLVRQKNIDAGNITFWQQGYVYYDDEPIGEIVQDLEHINNVLITVKDQSVLNTRITTSFNKSIGADQELKLICKLIDKQLTKKNGQYVIE